MRLDSQLRAFILAVWEDRVTQGELVRTLTAQPEPKSVVCARKIKGSGTIDSNILVVTEDAVGYGWPMSLVLWRKK